MRKIVNRKATPLAFAVVLLLGGMGIANSQNQYAILIGVNEYAELGEEYRLDGSGNDLQLMKEILKSYGEFNVVELSSKAGSASSALLPTRANIVREMNSLIAKVEEKQSGNIVFYFTGHGSQQPALNQASNFEADELDEVILPCDTGKFMGDGAVKIPNAITDNEIGDWIRTIDENGAELWAIFDCCHSGDLARSSGVRYKFIPPEDLGISNVDSAVPEKKKDTPVVSHLGNTAVLYACKSGEKAIEQPIPQMEGRPHGLLTYSLFNVLRQNKDSLSHREIRQRVYESYIQLGRFDGPTPSVEGGKVNSSVFGKELLRKSKLRISEIPPSSGDFLLNAGLTDGLSVGAILSVFSPNTPAKLMGYVTVTECSAFLSNLKPVAHGSLPALDPELLNGLHVKFEEVDFDILKVKVGLDPSLGDKGETTAQLKKVLSQIAQDPKSALSFASESNSPSDWLLRLQKQTIFLHRNGATDKSTWIKVGLHESAKPENLKRQIQNRVRQIAKGQNLLRIVNDRRFNPDSDEPSFEVEIRVFEDERAFEKKEGRVLGPSSTLRPGNVIQYLVTNTGVDSFDLTVLEVNSRMEIAAHFPTENRSSEIESSPDSVALPAVLITDNTYGRVHLVFIAVKSVGQSFNLWRLADSDLEAYRNSGPSSPLKSLLESSVFGTGTTRASPNKLDVHKTLVSPINIVEGK